MDAIDSYNEENRLGGKGMELIRKEYVFTDAQPFVQCHASTVLCLPNGELLAAWFGGTCEGNDDVMIWLSRRGEAGWSQPVCVSAEPGLPHWNPVLHQSSDGTVTLYYKVGRQIPRWKTMVTVSHDEGRTWTIPRELVLGDEGGRGPVKNKPLISSQGLLLAPASIEQGSWRGFIDISEDGRLWHKREIPGDVGMIQPTLWEYPEGTIHALLRTNAGKIYRSDSMDGGETWCFAYPTDVPNNNSGLDLTMTPSGILVLVCNPVEKDWGPRTPLSLFLSRDGGESFCSCMDLESGPGEYSYPAVIASGDDLHITYTYNRKTIAYCQIRL